jgi:hypothetical protein
LVANAPAADTTPPVITVPADMSVEAAGPDGTVVVYDAAATDDVDGDISATCDPPSGTTFLWYTVTVTCMASDSSGNTGSASFTITVVDTVPPLVTVPPDATLEATGADGAALSFSALATDTVDGTVTATCDPASGTTFPLGTTMVTCSAIDAQYNVGLASFMVTVQDTTVPMLSLPPDVTLEATSPEGAPYAFAASARDVVDGNVSAACTPDSGSFFPVATTIVGCTATDAAGNNTATSFLVTVRDLTPPMVVAPPPISVAATEMGGARGDVAGSLASQQLSAFLAGASAVDLHDLAPVEQVPRALINGTMVDATASTLLPPGTTSIVFRFKDASGNEGTASSTVTVTARIVDEPTVVHLMVTGAARLQALQNPDGGWSFEVGSSACGGEYGSCPNTIGTTALGLLAAYARSGDTSTLIAAKAAGDAIVARFEIAMAQTPAPLPVNPDIEFLVALAQATGDAVYMTTAQTWFQTEVDRFQSAADHVDEMIATRDAQGLRSLAAWDAASYIRAAKAVGLADRALAAAVRIRDLEPLWKDTDQTHSFDRCDASGGCGPAENALAFDYTILGEGSLLSAIHDLPGFDPQVNEYRSFLLDQQDPGGSWDGGDSQITAFVVMGLAAVGGTGANSAIAFASEFFLSNELPAGGWPATVRAAGRGAEYSEVDGEVVRAMATLFSTPAAADVSVIP